MLTIETVKQWRDEVRNINSAAVAHGDLMDRFLRVCDALVDNSNASLRPEQIQLTPCEMRLKQTIATYIARNGFAPSYDDLCDLTGYASRGNIHRFITNMIRKGHLAKDGRRMRTLRIVP